MALDKTDEELMKRLEELWFAAARAARMARAEIERDQLNGEDPGVTARAIALLEQVETMKREIMHQIETLEDGLPG